MFSRSRSLVSITRDFSIFYIETSADCLSTAFLGQCIYSALLVCIKFSIILFYLRIFPNQWFITTCKIMLAFIGINGLGWILLSCLRCRPITANWDMYSVNTACSDNEKFVLAFYVINVFQDLVILILPIPLLASIKVKLGRKLGLMAIFCVGILYVSLNISFLLN